jgi:hypothetical protein
MDNSEHTQHTKEIHMSFANLKKNRASSIDALVKAAESVSGNQSQQKSYGDDRFWKPTRDKSGNGYAVIRFLPAPDGEDLPWVRYWDHGFQGPTGAWYIENSLTSIGQNDPVSEYNSVLWNSGREEDKELARKQKRRLHYVSNIYVVSDPANPQNEGKVFLYKFGKKIFDKIMDVMQPQFQDETPVNPYDFWEGADFKIKIRNVQGWVNYDSSEFASQSPFLGGDDSELEAVYKQCHSLQDFVDPKNYKSYDELKAKLNRVLGEATPMTTAESIDLDESAPAPAPKAAPAPAPAAAVEEDGDDDTLSYFAKLAADS